VGLHANSGRIEELGPPRWSFDHRACPTRPWHSTESGARDDVADFCAGALAGTRGRRLFTTEVWTVRGLVTYYTAFVIELQRVQVLGSTPYPDEAFVIQCLRPVTGEPDALLREGRILVCDRDPKWSRAVEQLLSTTGVRVIRTPPCAPNCKRIRGEVRSVDQGGVPRSRGAAGGVASSSLR